MLELTFRYDYSTRLTFRFNEIDSITNEVLKRKDGAIGTLYVKKSVFKNIRPGEITVKLEW